MFKAAALKLAQMLLLFWGVTLVSFWVVHLAPGSAAEIAGGWNPAVGVQAREKLTKLYGLDRPLGEQYLDWALKMAVFDFGESFTDGEDARAKILKTIPVTLALNGLSLLLALAAGIPLGVRMAAKREGTREKAAGFVLLALYSLPGFWLALLLMSWLGVAWHWLPVTGLRSLFYEQMPWPSRIADLARHLCLPVLVLAASGTAVFSRYVKEAMEETLGQKYILAARARGLPERTILYRHALKNALLPLITLLGLSLPGLLGGSVVLESLFAIPGMGRLFFQSVFTRDYPVILGILTLGALLTLIGNALADLAYRLADPRIRREKDVHARA